MWGFRGATSTSMAFTASSTGGSEMSVRNSTALIKGSADDHEESQWLLVRLMDAFYAAVLQQSKENAESDTQVVSSPVEGAGTFLSYWMSPFSMMCMITAVIMNRIVIFASSRRHRRLPLVSNVILRGVAIYLLFIGGYGLLVSLKYYCGDNFVIKHMLSSDYFNFNVKNFNEKTFLSIPFGKLDSDSGNLGESIGPSTSILKSLHLALCISQILDTFISVASGSRASMETGITLFEYSLAFQEAQYYTTPSKELMVIAFIALLNQFNIHILGFFNLIQYKLITSSIIGLATLAFYSYNLLTGNIMNIPFIIIIGYFPHFCVLMIIIMSETIFFLSGLIRMSFEDLTMTSLMDNLTTVNISLSDDFYSALIKFGEFVTNMTITQCYVQETSGIRLPKDNYVNLMIDDLRKNLQRELSGYGVEMKNHPEMAEIDKERLLDEKSRNGEGRTTWIIVKRLKYMNLMIFRLIQMLIIRVVYFLRLRKSTDIVEEEESQDQETSSARALIGRFIQNATMVDVDEIDNEKLDELYPQLLLNAELKDNDASGDYEWNDDFSEDESIEQDSDGGDAEEYDDYEEGEYLASGNMEVSFNELFSVHDLSHMLNPSSEEDAKEHHILSYHMQHLNDNISRLTRSHFAKYYTDEMKLVDLLLQQKNRLFESLSGEAVFGKKVKMQESAAQDDSADHLLHEDLGVCVICHENSRQIILWPCKCLAICETCRVSLFVREFASCVCCRQPVEGFSKVYIP